MGACGAVAAPGCAMARGPLHFGQQKARHSWWSVAMASVAFVHIHVIELVSGVTNHPIVLCQYC